MHARVTSLKGSPADAQNGIDDFRANVVPFAREHGKGALLLIDRDTGDAMAITLWDDEESLRASEEQAKGLRTNAASQLGASEQPRVSRYEVAVFEV